MAIHRIAPAQVDLSPTILGLQFHAGDSSEAADIRNFESRKKMSTTSKFITAVSAFAGGIIAGMLLAPDSGRENRRRVAEKMKEQSRRLEEQIGELEDKYRDIEKDVVESGQEIADKLRDRTYKTVDHYLTSVPDDADKEWGIERDDVAQNLKRMPRR